MQHDDHRRTKRVRLDTTASLEEHVTARRARLLQSRLEVPELRARATALRDESRTMTARYQIRAQKDLVHEADAIDREADVRASMVREFEFERIVVSYLQVYHRNNPDRAGGVCDTAAFARDATTRRQRRMVLTDEYLAEVDHVQAKVAMAVRDECPYCAAKLLLVSAKSVMSCPTCGYSVTYLDTTSSTTSFDEVVDFSQYSYKRVNHYALWLALVQGKEAHRVPDDILQAVMQHLYTRHHVREVSEITSTLVRQSLRTLRLKKGYDHVAQITMRLTGVPPKRISTQTERQLKNMFLQMQPAFHRHAPNSRTNFLSYGYVLYRSFQILGLDHMLEGIALLKSRPKLEANDAIFRNMCLDLGWPVFGLPPVEH